MSDTLKLPDGRLRVELGDHAFSLDPILAVRETNAIADRCKGKSNYEHLDEFAAWVAGQGGPVLSASECDQLWKAIQIEHARAQANFLAALRSHSTTDSGPAA